MKSFFSKRDKRQSKTRGFNANAKFRVPVLERAFHNYVHIYEELFSQNALITIPDNDLSVPMPSSNIVILVNNFSHTYYRNIYIYISEEFFSKT